MEEESGLGSKAPDVTLSSVPQWENQSLSLLVPSFTSPFPPSLPIVLPSANDLPGVPVLGRAVIWVLGIWQCTSSYFGEIFILLQGERGRQ